MRYFQLILSILLIASLTQVQAQFRQNLSSKSNKESQYKANSSPFTQFRAMSVISDAEKDGFGNAKGNDYDLAKDGAFKGVQIAVLHLYTGEGFDFIKPQQALQEKGFKIKRWQNTPPSASELEAVLAQSSQLWIISDRIQKLNSAHLNVIKAFFNQGKGVYIWGDNDPYYSDANYVANALFGGKMLGNTYGDKILSFKETGQMKMGIKKDHDITTGIEHLYEGITIATIQPNSQLSPMLYGSAKNLVAAVYDDGRRRAVIDGGFTRLYVKWDTAGTGRYVKNAAAWLVNYDRFGEEIFAYKN